MTDEQQPRRVGKYEIVQEIGRGGFAVVYEARDTQIGREVALKVVHGNFAQEPDFVARFGQEVRTAANLRHRHIVPIYDFGDADGVLYLAMPLIGNGRTLHDLLRGQTSLSLAQALPILSQVADALSYLHRQSPPLVHRDIKPANLLLEGEGEALSVVLTDFGLVRSMEASVVLTQSGTTLGTPAYMSPEQAAPDRWGEVTPLSDVYALGVVAYEMLIGQVPFVGETATLLHAHAYREPPSPLESAPELGEDLAEVLMRALAKPPGERYPGASALVDALRAVADEREAQVAQRSELDGLLQEARAAHKEEDWLQVQSCCLRVLQIDRMHPDAMQMMAEAMEGLQRESEAEVKRRRTLARYEQGVEAQAARAWKEASAAFEAVAESNPDFRDVQERLAHVRDELQCAQAYDEAIAHGEEESWLAACCAWLNVLRKRWDYGDGDAAERFLGAVNVLVGQHRDLMAKLDERDEVLAKYGALVDGLEAMDPGQAFGIGGRVLPLLVDLGAPETLVAWVRQRVVTLGEEQGIQVEAPPSEACSTDDKEMVLVPDGPFLYGDGKEQMDLPAFWIDRTPVTNAEYARFVQATGREPPRHWDGATPPQDAADHPVVYVTWHDAVAYAEWAGKRLPTEQEWEKAARGAEGRVYPWGDEWETDRCNTEESGVGGTTSVGKYSPAGDSPFGCVDMAGNVWEWTASWYDAKQEDRVVRGGSWYFDRDLARCSFRRRYYPDYSYYSIGFRCVSPISCSGS